MRLKGVWPEPERTENGCNYHGQMFGATYPDACCIAGYLWDEDCGEHTEDGFEYTSGGELPCPNCNRQAAVDSLVSDWSEEVDELTDKVGRYPRRIRPHRAKRQLRKHLLHARRKWGFFGDDRPWKAKAEGKAGAR